MNSFESALSMMEVLTNPGAADALGTLLAYLSRTAPAIMMIAATFVFLRPAKHVRVLLYLLTFVLLRDALTPLSLWRFGVTEGVPWIRFFPSHLFLAGMALSSLVAVVLLVLLDRDNSRDVVFIRKGQALQGWLAALSGLAVLLAPFLILYQRVGIPERGGGVDSRWLGSILAFALMGNLLEELLFRGYVYNLLRKKDPDLRAGVATGFVFCLCHVFLATTVTPVGAPLLLFTLWEGVICGIVGARYGVLPATLVHGGGIFVLASGVW